MTTIQIIAIAFSYVFALFLIAYYSDKYKKPLINPTRKALVYSFSLAIYCTSWTFYGAVGSAAENGWGYLPIYLGPILVYTLGFPLLRRFVRVGHEQNTTSISDFIAARYGKSQIIATIVTIIAVIAIIPYIALQLKAITASIEIFDAQQNLFTEQYSSAFYITLMLIVFSILFGTRNIDVTEHQHGMMNAIAFESFVKLIAFCSVGYFALYSVFDGPSEMLEAIETTIPAEQLWISNIHWENFFTQTILAASAIFCLPRQFHVSVVEFHQKKDLLFARWIFPIYLTLISFFVIPIVLAGMKQFSGGNVPADTYILALPIAQNQSALSALVFIGGLSAATGMVIVATVALSTMVSNDLVLPLFLKRARSEQFKNKKFAQQLLLARRIIIAFCLLLSYAFYRLIDKSQSLAAIGYLSFTAVLQFSPALLLGLVWNRANEKGAIAGLLCGILCWFILTWIPSINGADLLANKGSYFGYSILTESVFISLVINILATVLISFSTEQSLTEKIQAYAYTRRRIKEVNLKKAIKTNSELLVKDLKNLTATIVGSERMISAFENFDRNFKDTDKADQLLLNQTERVLSAAIGSSSARVVILSALKDKGIAVDDVINLLSSTSQALKFNRHLTEVTLDNITQGISVSDPDKNLVAWNNRYEKLLNYPKGFLQTGMPIAKLIRYNAERGYCGPGDTDEHIAKRLAHLESGLSYRFERERSDGITLEIVGNPLPQGGYVTTYTDISEYKKIEAALKENERNIALYTDNSPALLAYLDTQLIYRFVNRTFADSLNLKKSEILGKRAYEVLSPGEMEFKLPYVKLALQNKKQQFEYASEGNNSRYYLITYIPNVNSQGDVTGVYTISQDISNRRKAELALKEINITLEERVEMRTEELHATVRALEVAKKESEQANQSKSRFLAAASHDLLQPFNAARLFAEMLKNESSNMTETQAQLVKKTDQSLVVAENIIRSLVDISKLDSGTIQPKRRSFDLFETLNSIEQQFSRFAQNKHLKFKVMKKHVQVDSDPELLYRVLQNFVSNAIRYTENGGILISAQKRNNFVRLSVWDTGIGIPETNRQEIFNEFKRLSDPNIKNSESGLGLGLSISERIGNMLNHPIQFRSEYGRGSVFYVDVKLADLVELPTNSPAQVSKTRVANLENVKALCVDNEQQIVEAMSMLLERWGCDVKTARGESEIDPILTDSFVPEVMLVDYQLDHGKTGIDFIQKIRSRTGIEIPAIVVTADHSAEIKKEINDAGLILLNKPVKPAVLRATIGNLMR
ncbi:NahK/ErcS family hybrid sensor histidine kinase/response regulator [Aliikangiella sp. G2MR2-5]|uniref:hybrid sensor histidine kinase/response regulator n=1 Tax=Aliikangiella sp. G2MR2-5 TaxID=2788943 RepID=UPI0018A8B8C0|nr:NahK/ErcS family hybrid sensor histidine kinase/response regulator [Aliikangiella sp. G2MR2-5]